MQKFTFQTFYKGNNTDSYLVVYSLDLDSAITSAESALASGFTFTLVSTAPVSAP